MKVKTYKEAWNNQTKPDIYGWIQWKGTDVCIDINCECGMLSHFDGDFMYVIQCPHCNRKYFANGHIQLIEIEDDENNSCKIAFANEEDL